MATYPNDATATLTAFPVTSTITYSSTGGSTTEFNLAAAVSHRGEVSAFIDGVAQATDSYSISNSGATVSFTTPPDASNLTLQTVSIPAKLVQTRSTYSTFVQEYSNTSTAVVNGNTYLINAHQEAFALPASVDVSSVSEIQVFVSGVLQNSDAYVYPSTTLGYSGIDIGDNTATKLLLNFTSNLTDESVSAHTVSHNDTATYATLGDDTYISFDGVDDFLTVPSSDDFNLQDRSFTLDTWVKPDTGTTMTSNQTLFARYGDGTNYYVLRLVGSNSNIGMVVSTAGEITEVYGGNANGGSNYHVAVSYDANFANLRLYVNNVNVSYAEMYANQATGGDVSIASNNSVGAELLTGDISFVRLSHATRYKSATHAPITSTSALTQISGAPLGSVDQEDSLSIRVFDSSVETIDRFTSMADRKPDNGIESQRTFDVTTFASQAGYEKRRLKSRRSKRNYQLSYTAVTGVEKTAIENFYNARSGQFESFSFDLSHINESGTITTRFEGPLSIEQTYSVGSRLIDNFYTVSFTLQEVFD
jgi:hypothetical protein